MHGAISSNFSLLIDVGNLPALLASTTKSEYHYNDKGTNDKPVDVECLLKRHA